MNSPRRESRGGLRARVRAYCTACMMTMALIGSAPRGHVIERPAIVRITVRRTPGEFDPRELVTASVALTVPLPTTTAATLDETWSSVAPLLN